MWKERRKEGRKKRASAEIKERNKVRKYKELWNEIKNVRVWKERKDE